MCIYIHRINIHRIQTNVNTDYYFECDESFDSPICIICLFFAGLVHATDYSNASATAIFDSYQVSYNCPITMFV